MVLPQLELMEWKTPSLLKIALKLMKIKSQQSPKKLLKYGSQ